MAEAAQAFTKIEADDGAEPMTLHLLSDKLADSVIAYLNARSGRVPSPVMVFDTCRAAVTLRDYRAILPQYMHKIVDGLIVKNGAAACRSPCSPRTVASGWSRSPPPAATPWGWTGPPTSRTPNAGSATGGAAGQHGSPPTFYATPDRIRGGRLHPGRLWAAAAATSSNLGHGIHRDWILSTPGVFVNARCNELSARYHGR